jgi:hypothetical protein
MFSRYHDFLKRLLLTGQAFLCIFCEEWNENKQNKVCTDKDSEKGRVIAKKETFQFHRRVLRIKNLAVQKK